MAIPKFLEDLNIISKLGDYPGSDNNLSTAQFKAKFDEAGQKIQNYINNTLLPHLNQLVDVQALLNGILDPSLSLPDKAANAKATGDALAWKIDSRGGTMTGALNVLAPTEDTHAAPKKYVDDKDTKSVPITLTASGWSASAPYTQSVEVNGLTDKLFAEAYPAWPDDAEAEKTLQEETAKVSSCRRSGSTLTFRCLVDKPAVDIPVMVEVST